MAYLTLQINEPSASVTDLNGRLKGGDASKPHEIVTALINLLDAINGGNGVGATITAVTSTGAGTVSGQTGGVSVTLNLL